MVFQNNVLLGASGSGTTTYSIDQSIRFNDNDSPYLSKAFSGAGDLQKATMSCWVKMGNISTSKGIFTFISDKPLELDSNNNLKVHAFGSNRLITDREFRDPSAWYHFVLSIDSTQAVDTERIRLYVNGQRETSFSTESYPSQNTNGSWWSSNYFQIGRTYGTSNYMDGYLAEIVYIDGTALDPSSFGEYNSSNIWIPKDVSGLTFGTNGFHIDGRDSADLGDDESGNGNDFTASGLSSDDQVADSPTNNHGVFNVLEKDLRYSTTISNGNKTITFPSGSTGFSGTRLGLFRSNGKAYAEFKVNQAFSFSSGDGVAVFVCDDTQDPVSAGGGSSAKLEAAYTGVDGIIYDGASNQGTGTTWNTVNAVVGIYIDFDNGKGWFSKDGTVQTVNGTPNVETGANPHFTFTANSTLTVGAGGVHYATPAIVTLQNYAGEWATTPTSYTAFSTKAEGEA
jgi:hypothetical protein